MGHPAHDRANAKRPVLSFRAPDQDFKDRVRQKASQEGFEKVQDFLLHIVESYMEGRPAPVRSNPVPEVVKKIDWSQFEEE